MSWEPEKLRLRPRPAPAVLGNGRRGHLPGRRDRAGFRTRTSPGAAFVVAAAIALLNAVLPPLIAALRLPFTLVLGFCSSSPPTR